MRFAIAAAAVALWVQPAFAATIIQTVNGSTLSGGTLALFDSSLGTLDSVDVTSTINFSSGIFGRPGQPVDGFPGLTIPLTGTGYLMVEGGSGRPGANLPSVPLAGSYFSPTGSQVGSINLSGSGTTTLTGGYLATFIGSGTTTVTPVGLVTGNMQFPPRPFASGTGTFTFNYTPAVPEPGTWAMMLIGFGLIGGTLRRRPRPSAPYASAHSPT